LLFFNGIRNKKLVYMLPMLADNVLTKNLLFHYALPYLRINQMNDED
jgi:hypothetical protein